jgi:PleD family two-component response regulator
LASIQSTDSQEEKNYFLKKRILIVDDESDITLSLKLGLEQYGFRVSTYNDPVLALSEFKADLYDLLIIRKHKADRRQNRGMFYNSF